MSAAFQVDGEHASTTINIEGVMGQVHPSEPYARKLLAAGSFTLFVNTGAAVHQPAADSVLGRHKVAYYSIIAGVFACVAVEMATAFWLTRTGGPRVRAFAKGLLPFAVMLLLAVVAAFGTAFAVKP